MLRTFHAQMRAGDDMRDKSHTGGCMCGAVRYRAAGEPKFVAYCHCHSCRKHTGAPVVMWVAFDPEQVKWTHGDRKLYRSSQSAKRGFCGDCGTPLTWEAPSLMVPGEFTVEFNISTLDNPDDYVPDRHWCHDERISWFEVADELPRYTTDNDDAPYRYGPAV